MTDSDHTAPPCIRNIRAHNLIWELGETRPVCEPWCSLKDLINFLLDLVYVFRSGNELLAKNVNDIIWSGELSFAILLEKLENIVLSIVRDILNFLS